MDETLTWARTYWGGALFCLQADVAIREQTGNRVGLQTALRAILKQTGGYRADRSIDEVLRIGDAATGTQVLQDLYREMKRHAAMTPDLGVAVEPPRRSGGPGLAALRRSCAACGRPDRHHTQALAVCASPGS